MKQAKKNEKEQGDGSQLNRDYKSTVSKENHSEIERRRRLTMNHYITELAGIFAKNSGRCKKMNKIGVLKCTVNYLKKLKESISTSHNPYSFSFLDNSELRLLTFDALCGFELKVSCDDGKILYVSEEVDCILGCKKNLLEGKSIFDVVLRDDLFKLKHQVYLHREKFCQIFDFKNGLAVTDMQLYEQILQNRRFTVRFLCYKDTTVNKDYFCPNSRYTYKFNNFKYSNSQRLSYWGSDYVLIECTGRYKAADEKNPPQLHLIARLMENSLLCEDELTSNQTCIQLSMDGSVLFVDKTEDVLVGFEEKELVQTPFVAFIHSEDLNFYLDVLYYAKKDQSSTAYFIRMKLQNKNGTYTPVKVRLKCICSVFSNEPEIYNMLLCKNVPKHLGPTIKINDDNSPNVYKGSSNPLTPSLSPVNVPSYIPEGSPDQNKVPPSPDLHLVPSSSVTSQYVVEEGRHSERQPSGVSPIMETTMNVSQQLNPAHYAYQQFSAPFVPNMYVSDTGYNFNYQMFYSHPNYCYAPTRTQYPYFAQKSDYLGQYHDNTIHYHHQYPQYRSTNNLMEDQNSAYLNPNQVPYEKHSNFYNNHQFYRKRDDHV